jgi:hypothetical protein
LVSLDGYEVRLCARVNVNTTDATAGATALSGAEMHFTV